MKYGLPKTTIEHIRGVFAHFPEIEKAILYGSRAKGTYQAGSDIDLTLYGDALTPDLRDKIVDALDDLLLPYTIDLSLFDELDHAKLREHIERVGVVFYERAKPVADIGAGWETRALGELCDISIGKTPSRGNKSYWDVEKIGSNVWLSIADLQNIQDGFVTDSKEYITEEGASLFKPVKEGTLLASFKLTLGRLAFAGSDLYTNEAIAALTIRNIGVISIKYLYHYLSHFDWNAATDGDVKVKGKTLNKKKLTELPISLPPLPEQKRIVSILDEAFAGIATAIANAKKNLANAREVFESTLQSVFSTNSLDWQTKRLGEVCQIKPPKSEAKKKLCESDMVSFVPMEKLGISQMFFDVSQERPLNEVAGSYTYFMDGDVLLAKITPCFENGKLGIARNLKNGVGFGSSEYIVLRCTELLNNKYLYYFLSRSSFREDGASRMTGAVGHKRVPNEFIENTCILVPDIHEQQHIVNKLDELSAETIRLESIYQQKLTALDELKKSILNQAFSGQLH